MTKPSAVVADDHALILDGIRKLLESRFEILATADNGQSLVREAERTRPDFIVLDVSMPLLNGIDAAHAIRKFLPRAKFIFISMHSNPVYVRKAVEAGACGYVLKSGVSEELLTALEEACQGRTYYSPGLSQGVFQELEQKSEKESRHVLALTSRQSQILRYIAEGKRNKEIASLLGVSVRTVEFHRSRLMSRLGAHSVAELTRFAIDEEQRFTSQDAPEAAAQN